MVLPSDTSVNGEEEKGISSIVIYKGIGLSIKKLDILKNHD